MGAGHSRVLPISYEEACKRVDSKVLQRIEETFRRTAAATGYLPQATFTKDVVGETVPQKLSEAIYHAFGGTQKGLSFKHLLTGLVVIVYGKKEEKAKLLVQMMSEDGEHIKCETVDALVTACDGKPSPYSSEMSEIFKDKICSVESFHRWLLDHPSMASFSTWLLLEPPGLDLKGEPDSLTFYQTLANKYSVSEQDVMDIEKTYWALKGSGKFDLETFQEHVSPPLPQEILPDLFRILDINSDEHLDLSEVINAVSIWCGRDSTAIQKFCFSVFDTDCDGQLSRPELVSAITHMMAMKTQNCPPGPSASGTVLASNGGVVSQEDAHAEGGASGSRQGTPLGSEGGQQGEDGTAEDIADSALEEYGQENVGYLSVKEYCSWAVCHPQLANQLPNLLFEISHIQLGVRPKSKEDEARVVGGYLLRFAKCKRKPGDLVYLISSSWFQTWMEFTGYQGFYPSLTSSLATPPSSHKRKKTRKAKHVVEHKAYLAPPTTDGNRVEGGEEAIEIPEVIGVGADKSPSRGSAVSEPESEASILSKDDALKPPPIDNSALCVQEPSGIKKLPSLTNEGGRLVTNKLLVEGKDFILLPEVVWRVFVSWYCSSAYNSIPTLPRKIADNGVVDLYPVFFKLYRHTTVPLPAKPSSLPWPLVSLMHNLGIGSTTPTPSQPVVVSGGVGVGSGGRGGEGELPPTQAPTPRRVPSYTAAFVQTATLAEISEKIQQMLHVKSEDLRLYDLTADEDAPKLLEDEAQTIEDLGFNKIHKAAPKEGFKLLIETRNKDNTWPEEMIALVKEMQEKDKAKQKSSQQNSNVHVPPGATGLSNLGNTCFMNSALQCVSNAQPLTQYFENKDHLLEINKDNPLGMQGVMAKRYGELIHELWNGSSKSITPLKFRFTVGRCAPHFTAFQQQDAQELLAFVLDGLHEDLNRVKEKPYRELKDSDGRSDTEVAEEAWDYHLSRNRSIVVDLFHGQLKSEVTCKVCQYKSVKFDPFTFLSLPLPTKSTVNLEVIVMFLDGRQPVKYGLRLEIDEKYEQLKEELAELCELPASRLLLVEMYASNIRNWPSDTTKIRNVLGGWLYAYELPTTSLLPTTKRSDSPDEILRKQKLSKVKRERTLSLKHIEESRAKAARVREKLTREGLRGRGREEEEEEEGVGEEGTSPKRRKVVIDVQEQDSAVRGQSSEVGGEEEGGGRTGVTKDGEGGVAGLEDDGSTREERMELEDSDEMCNLSNGSGGSGTCQETYVFAVHRRLYTVDHYFVSSQKSRPSLFSIPLVVPCTCNTPRKDLYASVLTQVKRLIIPDPPNSEEEEKGDTYPFQLKQVTSDGMSCSVCPWYRFCQGCPIPCDSDQVGKLEGRFIGVDWDNTTLHLKYLLAQEKPDEHESMESLKSIDTQPIDLYRCFKAFVREDQLGDEESWYCKKCKTHREAIKSLEVWKFPPILIIHLKRFQFVNGRWIKSQRAVTFPLEGLDPMRYTVQNGNGSSARTSGNTTPLATPTEATNGDDPSVKRLSTGEETPSGLLGGVREAFPGQHDVVDGAEECKLEEAGEKGVGLEEGGGGAAAEEEELVNGIAEAEDPEGGVNGEGEREGAKDTDSAGDTCQSSTPNSEKLYNLFAISCHTGVLGGGHYTSFAKNVNGMWYYFNDSSCKETTPERVEQESPYMLFYELQNIDKLSNTFRAENKQGSRQEIGTTEDDREYEETIKNIKKSCSIQ